MISTLNVSSVSTNRKSRLIMGRTKSKPAHKSTIRSLSSNPSFSYFSASSEHEGPEHTSAVAQDGAAFVNASLTLDNGETSDVNTEQSYLEHSESAASAKVDDMRQSQQVLLHIEPHSPSVNMKPSEEVTGSLDHRALATVNCIISDSEEGPIAQTHIYVCRFLLSSKVYDEMNLSLFHKPISRSTSEAESHSIILTEHAAIGALLPLCFLLCSPNGQFQKYPNSNCPTEIRRRLLDVKEAIRPILTACSHDILSVVVILPERSDLHSPLSDPSHNNISNGASNCPTTLCESIHVEIRLTPAALEKCCPRALPRSPPLTKSTQLSATHVSYAGSLLRDALAIMFPDTVVADVAENPNPDGRGSCSTGKSISTRDSSKNRSALSGDRFDGPITAKMIYGVVDNAHAHEFCSSNESINNAAQPTSAANLEIDHPQINDSMRQGLKIPGLNPTLRPYQEAAVRWMISREIPVNDNSEDVCWQVCWVVLDATNHTAKSLFECASEQGELCLYNPFSGWICTSIEEARNATLDLLAQSEPVLSSSKRLRGGILAESMGL